MSGKKLKILLIFDLAEPPPVDQDYQAHLREDDWWADRELVRALKRIGHDVTLFGIYDDIDPFIQKVKELQPDVVF